MVRIYATSSDPALQQELQLKLARKCLHACGISLFDLEKDLHIISESPHHHRVGHGFRSRSHPWLVHHLLRPIH